MVRHTWLLSVGRWSRRAVTAAIVVAPDKIIVLEPTTDPWHQGRVYYRRWIPPLPASPPSALRSPQRLIASSSTLVALLLPVASSLLLSPTISIDLRWLPWPPPPPTRRSSPPPRRPPLSPLASARYCGQPSFCL